MLMKVMITETWRHVCEIDVPADRMEDPTGYVEDLVIGGEHMPTEHGVLTDRDITFLNN